MSLFDLFRIDFSDDAIKSSWPRCANCDRQFPNEEDFQLVSYHTQTLPGGPVEQRVCNECATPRKVYLARPSDTYSATTYENHEMVCGFGPTEQVALMDLRERFAERFNRDIVNFVRA